MSKKFTKVDRIRLQDLLTNSSKLNFKEIGKALNKDGTSISREIKKYLTTVEASTFNSSKSSRCIYATKCSEKHLCSNCRFPRKFKCSTCDLCVKVCKKFDTICPKLKKVPYVCNGCENFQHCRLDKRVYYAEIAHKNASELRSERRSNTCLNKRDFLKEDELLTNLICKGQSIHHIFVSHSDEFNCTEKTIRNRIKSNVYSCSRKDLPASKRVKSAKAIKREPMLDKVLANRTYSDFLAFKPNIPCEYVEMDTVIGRVGGKVLLTFQFVQSHFMLAFLLENKTAESVLFAFYNIRNILAKHNLSQHDLMPVILTDNGKEFSKVDLLETSQSTGEILSNIFFCNPYCSSEKPHVENNHKLIRRIVSHDSSFDFLTQQDINLMMSHINSYKRLSLMDKSPYELFENLHPGIASMFGITNIESDEIILNKHLLDK